VAISIIGLDSSSRFVFVFWSLVILLGVYASLFPYWYLLVVFVVFVVFFTRGERISPGGLRGLQIRCGAVNPCWVGSTPMRSRQKVIT
jgi:hypothetical protein